MGGKQSTEATPGTSNQNAESNTGNSASHPNNAVGSSRRVHALNQSSRNPAFTLNGESMMRTTTSRSHRPTGTRSDHRQHRSHSTADTTGMRLSRPGFEWFLASHLAESGVSAEDNRSTAGSSRNFSHSMGYRPANLSRSLPPFFFRPNRGN